MSYLTSEQEELFNKNYYLVYYTLKKCAISYNINDVDDICAEGFIALMHACKDYDASTGYNFSTFACVYIRNQILVTVKKLARARKLEAMSLDDVCRASTDNDGDKPPIAKSAVAGVIGQSPDADNIIDKVELNRVLGRIDCLRDKWKEVALKTIQGYSCAEIARELGVSREFIRIYLTKIRDFLKASPDELKTRMRVNSIYYKIPKF